MSDTDYTASRPAKAPEDSLRQLFTLFTVFWWVGYPLALVLIGIPMLIAAIVFACIILYRHWDLFQEHGARTSPGKAVGFSFIPFFNFYWWFVAYAGLVEDNNNYMDRNNIDGPRMSYGLAITMCIIGIIDWTIGLVITPVGLITLIPAAIIGFLFVRQQKNSMLAILADRNNCTVSTEI